MYQQDSVTIQLNLHISRDTVTEVLSQFLPLHTPTPEFLMEVHIIRFLQRLGIPVHISGYQFLKEAFLIIHENEDYLHSITKYLYPQIAHQHNTTIHSVERAIRHAIVLTFLRGNKELLALIFHANVSDHDWKPSNLEFIATVYEYLRLHILF